MGPLDLVKLSALMERNSGSPELKIGLIDGPVVTQHPDLVGEHLREIPGNNGGACTQADSAACLHGTFVAGILCAKRGSAAPAMSQLHPAGAPHLCRNESGERRDAERDARGTCPSHP